MYFLVLGCNGMAGHLISLYLQERGHRVLGFGRRESAYVKSVVGDAGNFAFLKKLVEQEHFDTIINCIGLLNQNAENNKSDAVLINAYLPHYLAEITSGTDTQVIQMSTDCVFSGKNGPYKETDVKDGQTFYDRSKALGELEDNKNLTLRNSIVGPDINKDGIGLFNWFMKQNGIVNGYTKAVWTGQSTLQLAKTMEFAAEERISGLCHAVPPQSITKYDLLKLFNHYFRHDALTIVPVEGAAADKSLLRTRIDSLCPIPDYETMVREMAAWVYAHKSMYSHYLL